MYKLTLIDESNPDSVNDPIHVWEFDSAVDFENHYGLGMTIEEAIRNYEDNQAIEIQKHI